MDTLSVTFKKKVTDGASVTNGRTGTLARRIHAYQAGQQYGGGPFLNR